MKSKEKTGSLEAAGEWMMRIEART